MQTIQRLSRCSVKKLAQNIPKQSFYSTSRKTGTTIPSRYDVINKRREFDMKEMHYMPFTDHKLPRDFSGFAEKFVDGATVSSPSWAWSHDPSVSHLMLTRADVTMLLLCAKNFKGVSFSDIAKKIDRSEMWTTAALMGEFSVQPEEAEKLLDFLTIDKKWQPKIIQVLTEATIKASHPITNTSYMGAAFDPSIQRLFEIMKIYGPSLKAVVNEKLGDGNLSAVDVKVDVVTGRHHNGGERPRVKIVIDTAFEPFMSY